MRVCRILRSMVDIRPYQQKIITAINNNDFPLAHRILGDLESRIQDVSSSDKKSEYVEIVDPSI